MVVKNFVYVNDQSSNGRRYLGIRTRGENDGKERGDMTFYRDRVLYVSMFKHYSPEIKN